MTDITIGEAQRLTSPAPFALLSTLRDDGVTNLAAVSWWTYLSNHPATVGVCVSKKGLSGSLIEKNRQFGLSVVGEELRDAALECGRCSGRSVDKAKEFSIPLIDAVQIAPMLVAGSRVTLECRLADILEVGDHVLYVGHAEVCRGDDAVKQLFAFDGYSCLDTVERR